VSGRQPGVYKRNHCRPATAAQDGTSDLKTATSETGSSQQSPKHQRVNNHHRQTLPAQHNTTGGNSAQSNGTAASCGGGNVLLKVNSTSTLAGPVNVGSSGSSTGQTPHVPIKEPLHHGQCKLKP
jgi:hypothetical protein